MYLNVAWLSITNTTITDNYGRRTANGMAMISAYVWMSDCTIDNSQNSFQLSDSII